MSPDLEAIVRRIDADPKDMLSVQALADYLEERGADPSALRALTVDGPTVLVLKAPYGAAPDDFDRIVKTLADVCKWLHEHSGHPVRPMLVPEDYTFLTIKAKGLAEPARDEP